MLERSSNKREEKETQRRLTSLDVAGSKAPNVTIQESTTEKPLLASLNIIWYISTTIVMLIINVNIIGNSE